MSAISTSSPSVELAPASRLDTLPPWTWAWNDRSAPPTLGYHVIAWAEGWLTEFYPDDFVGLIQPNGPRGGQRFKFTPRQETYLLWWYALDREGHWLFTHGARRLAKGSGKSPFAAVFALAEFCAPTRLERFDDRMPGGVRGRPVDMPLVQIAATAESQTANTMRMVRAFAPKGSAIVDHYHLDPGKTRYYKTPEGTLEILTSSFTAVEGAEASAVVADETEWWTPAKGGPELASTLIDNLAKSGSRMWETANAWIPGQESVAEDTYAAWIAQEEERTRGETRILYDAVMAHPDTDMADPDSLKDELNRIYHDCYWQDLRPIMERIWSPKSLPSESRRKYLNRPSVSEDAWVDPVEWERLADPTHVVPDGAEIVAFFDGSKSRDATALVACEVETGHIFTLGVWEPDPNDPESTVDASDVDRVVALMFDRYTVVAFFGDVREFESQTLTLWPQTFGDSIEVWAAPASRPAQPIAWDMRSHKVDFAKAAEACHAEILDAAFTHDGDSRTHRHVVNARRHPYQMMISIGKASPSSPHKIDAAVCVIGARMVRRLVLASPRKKKRTGVVTY